MEFAFVEFVRTLPIKGATGICPGCKGQVLAKCGSIKVHHWAHKSKVDCDPWWENETEWHRAWKGKFAPEFREVVLFDEGGREYHRADVFTKTGVTIEFQNSPLTMDELLSRETFYPKLIWILNGKKLKGFKLLNFIPDPHHPQLKDYEIVGGSEPKYFHIEERFWPAKRRESRDLSTPHISNIHLSPWNQSFIWKNVHKVWLYANHPVLIDIGDDFLYLIKKRKQIFEDFLYLRKILKNSFINRYS